MRVAKVKYSNRLAPRTVMKRLQRFKEVGQLPGVLNPSFELWPSVYPALSEQMR